MYETPPTLLQDSHVGVENAFVESRSTSQLENESSPTTLDEGFQTIYDFTLITCTTISYIHITHTRALDTFRNAMAIIHDTMRH